ncbi:MAG: S-methyl-5'-thioadenosine phosphorylase [Desulfovibrionaceae bacterium]
MLTLGIIGGSGLDDPDILDDVQDMEISTPYGTPTSPLKIGRIGDRKVVLAARHGRTHTDSPTRVNNRANLWALKECGCECILATTAVGSLREEIDRGDLVILDQFIDFTRLRSLTFHETFEPHTPIHTPMATPFSSYLRDLLKAACLRQEVAHHDKGTVVTIEGPRFSTRAESNMFRAWGADVINMSTAPECILANELGLPYAAVAMSTDYDCWKEDEAPVSWEDVLQTFNSNVNKVTRVLLDTVRSYKTTA